jgi:hypothetical protein
MNHLTPAVFGQHYCQSKKIRQKIAFFGHLTHKRKLHDPWKTVAAGCEDA